MKRVLITITLALFMVPFVHAQDIKLKGKTSAENNQIKNVSDPTDSQDAATKNYVDSNVNSFSGSYSDLTNKPTTITTEQASAIEANTAKNTFPGFGTTAGKALEGDTALLQLGTTSTTALAGNTTTITTEQANAITANTSKTGITTDQASAIEANTAKNTFPGFGTTSGKALEGDTALFSGSYSDLTNKPTTITTEQADAIAANTSKTGITTEQANAIVASVKKADFSEGTILYATNDNTPQPISIEELRNLLGDGNPTGTTIAWTGSSSSIPAGYLHCNGQSVSRTTYSALFAVIGTSFGSVDANSFNVPDYRDMFLRGASDTRDVNTYQADEFKQHSHNYDKFYNRIEWASNFINENESAGDETNQYSTVATSNTGGSETRPKNWSVHYLIKI